LKHVLGQIDANRGNLHVDGPLNVIRLDDHPYGTSMPGAGAVHHIKSGREQMQQVGPRNRYSINSSARASNDGGTAMPSALAVLRLIVRLNLLCCSTGMSLGLAPLRTLST